MTAITPEYLARSGTEHGEQAAIFCWITQQNPATRAELDLLFAIPNGGSRGDTARSASIRGSQLKAEGVKSGVPDMFLPIPKGQFAGLFIELKRADGKPSDVSAEQREWHTQLRARQYAVVVCFGWKSAVDAILKYLTGMTK